MPKSRREAKIKAREKDFLDALDRLKRGKPNSPALALKAAAGRLRINKSTVALEAGHRRSHIASATGLYERVLTELEVHSDRKRDGDSSADTIAQLRERVKQLEKSLSLSNTQNATLVRRLDQIEEKVLRTLKKAERASNNKKRDQYAVSGVKLEALESTFSIQDSAATSKPKWSESE